MFRTIETGFWTDPRIRQLTPDAKLLFLYLITNSHAHVGGIYYLPSVIVAHETGLANTVSDTLWDTLAEFGLAKRDLKHDVIWVVNMLRHQGRGKKVYISVGRHLGSLHNSELVHEFVAHYPQIKRFYKHRVSNTPSTSSPDMDLVGLQDQDQDQDNSSNINSKNNEGYSPSFNRFWEAYPKRVGKADAFKAWKKAVTDCRKSRGLPSNAAAIEFIVEAASDFSVTPKAQGEFCPYPGTWLRDARYEDDRATWQSAGGTAPPVRTGKNFIVPDLEG